MNSDDNSVIPFYIKLCSDKAAYEVKLQRKIDLPMEHLKHLFETTKRYEIVMYTPYITVIRNRHGAEVTLSKDGRILIKEVFVESEARDIAENLLSILLNGANK